MKTFINVLYRKILYKIPLKFLLLILVIIGVLYYNYSSADDVEDLITKVCSSSNPNCSYFLSNQSITSTYQVLYTFDGTNTNVDIRGHTVCVKFSNWSTQSTSDVFLGFANNTNNAKPYNSIEFDQNKLDYQCIYVNSTYSYIKAGVGAGTSPITVNIELFVLDDLLATALPKLTSLECQTEYNLIPISSVDQNYCTTNNLCPSCPSCPSYPIGGSGYSNVYINDILHIGAPNIIMNIAEEIDWDYAYTASGYNMNIDVVGYNVDYDKIDSIVDNQSYKPSSEDFANILGILAPYTKIIVFFVFLFLVWAWIKKPFKSKKL